MTYLAVPISAETPGKAIDQIKIAVNSGAELLELRTDYLQNLTSEMVKKLILHVKNEYGKAFPVIITCRDVKQAGKIDYPVKLRIEILANSLKAGADYVDFEYENFMVPDNQEKIKVALADSVKGRLILSHHDFKTKFKNITALYRKILTFYPPAIPKIVYTANHINDCFDAFDLLSSAGEQSIVFAMGQAGAISRILAKKLGSLITFACIDQNQATAPGQISISDFKNIYRLDDINKDTELYGIIGSPVAHSMGPAIHNAAFKDLELNKLYLPLLINGGYDHFKIFMDGILRRNSLNFKGFSITIPHKENALKYINEKGGTIDPLAEKIGAINTIIIGPENKLIGHNTDYAGAIKAIVTSIGSREKLQNMPVAVIGAGGVSRAIIVGLVDAGAKVKIYNRTTRKAKKLAKLFDCEYASLTKIANIDAKLLINCTSLGMTPETDVSPLPAELHNKNMTVFDTIYNPLETKLLSDAKAAKAKTITGLEMFINQATNQFELFTNTTPNKPLMQQTALTLLTK